MLNIVMFGAPGSGKGTQSEVLIKTYGLFHISTGDVLRDHIKRGTDLGKTAKEYIDKGQLIPDELMVDILASVVDDNKEAAQNGVIFDGFPRTIPQAEALVMTGRHDHIFTTGFLGKLCPFTAAALFRAEIIGKCFILLGRNIFARHSPLISSEL